MPRSVPLNHPVSLPSFGSESVSARIRDRKAHWTWQYLSMSNPVAELSSVSTALEELTRRVGDIAAAESDHDDGITHELFEIERALSGAHRRLAKLVHHRT